MCESKKVDMKTLEECFLKIMNYYKENENTEFYLEDDYYWDVDLEKRYDPSANLVEGDISLGQLYHDIEVVEEVAKGKEPIGYDLVWLSSILRYVGEKII